VPGPPVPAGVDRIAARVDGRIKALLDAEVDRWSGVDPDLAMPLNALRDLVLAGGKRLRPAFAHWAFVGAGGDPDDPTIVDAGAALELLHTFALVHDDVMDGSATRRAAPTIHELFRGLHGDAGWRGEARRFGEGAAILIGDLAFVYADALLASAPSDALEVFSELRIEVNIGQYLDLLNAARPGASPSMARRIIRYKSGKYTVERPLHLGAALAGRLGHLRAGLTRFGLPLGDAFQLRDDLLGAFGDSAATGKPVGDDLREGKPTLLLTLAVERSAEGSDERAALDQAGNLQLDAGGVAAIQAAMESTGARAEVERIIDALATEALTALADLPITDDANAGLADLARFVACRAF
jgi:geranylgeranyl diphosphate synthase, type I